MNHAERVQYGIFRYIFKSINPAIMQKKKKTNDGVKFQSDRDRARSDRLLILKNILIL